MTDNRPEPKAIDYPIGMKKKLLSICTGITGVTVLFCIAGTLFWRNLWIVIVLMGFIGVMTSKLFAKFPGLAEERRTAGTKSKPWDVRIVRCINLALPAMFFVAAFDFRFHWFPSVPVFLSTSALCIMVLGALLTYVAISANPFFSSHIRIQTNRGHRVMSAGPYQALRHPGYAGSLLFNLSAPFALGSWACLPIGIAVGILLIYRTAMEDKILMTELAGYRTYAQHVRYRLIPCVW